MRLRFGLSGILLLAVALAGCTQQGQMNRSAAESDGKTPIFFSITSGPDDPHPVTMALQLAGHALDDQREVVLFFNVRGVNIPTVQLSDTLAFGDSPIKEMLAGLIERGAEVHVCPHCMSALGVEATDLVEGARVTTRESLFAHLQGNTAVFTY